ncbi:MAG: hypothetical protein ACF8NJ_08660 [Phycisphaerales bacterium JB038]
MTYPDLDAPPAPVAVDSVPLFRVGLDPSGRLFERIEDVTVLADGRIAVVDGRGTQEIVILDQDGSVIEVLGGHGEGPGEFTWLSRVARVEGGLVAQDSRTARATVYSGTEVVATYSLPFLEHKAILGATDGSFLLGPPLMMVQGRLYPEPWRRVALTTSAPPFTTEDTIAVVDWDQSLDFNGRDPWAASGMAVFDGERAIYGRGDRPELTWYGLDGSPLQIVRWESPPESVTDSAYAEFEEDWLELVGGGMSPDAIRGFREDMARQHRGVSPYFDQLFVDEDGTVWLGGFLRPQQRTEEFERPYWLFSRTGDLLGTVVLPAELRVRDITKDMVVGYELGPYNEPVAVGYRIERATGEESGSQP